MIVRALAALSLVLGLTAPARAQAPAPSAAYEVDRAVVRFWAPDTGGVRSPRFVFARVLAFEARLEALSEPDHDTGSDYRPRHVSAALERHIAETLLASLRIDPEPTAAEIERQIRNARAYLVDRVGGEAALARAAEAEGIGSRDLYDILRRQALASLYLDRMVAPLVEPTIAELRRAHAAKNNPFHGAPFDAVREGLRRWYVGRKLSEAVQAYYQNARSRLRITVIGELPGGSGT